MTIKLKQKKDKKNTVTGLSMIKGTLRVFHNDIFALKLFIHCNFKSGRINSLFINEYSYMY